MIYKLFYISRKNKDNIFSASVKYEEKKYNSKNPMLKILDIDLCTDEYLKNIKIGDHFIIKDIKQEDFYVNLNIFEWESDEDKEHYYFDIYYNYDNNIPNTILIKMK